MSKSATKEYTLKMRQHSDGFAEVRLDLDCVGILTDAATEFG